MRVAAACLALAVLTTAGAASASNGTKPRTPVAWPDDACATTIDRSTTPTLHFAYEVPFEDLGPLSDDEVADSRTHQFFAFARLDYAAVGTAQRLPPWITLADIERAALVDPEVVPEQIASADVLESTPRFAAAEWTRVTADDARVPISRAQAALGVDWALATVAPGVYTVWGYTWEPLGNLWSPRPGFVKVTDGDADAAGPAIALLDDDAVLTIGEPHAVLGCADVPPGTTVTLDWGVVDGPIEPEWEPLLVDAPIDGGALELAAVLPEHAEGDGPGLTLVRLRATVVAPDGRRHVAYSPNVHEVEVGAAAPDAAGCGCTSTPSRPWWLVLVVLVGATARVRGSSGWRRAPRAVAPAEPAAARPSP